MWRSIQFVSLAYLTYFTLVAATFNEMLISDFEKTRELEADSNSIFLENIAELNRYEISSMVDQMIENHKKNQGDSRTIALYIVITPSYNEFPINGFSKLFNRNDLDISIEIDIQQGYSGTRLTEKVRQKALAGFFTSISTITNVYSIEIRSQFLQKCPESLSLLKQLKKLRIVDNRLGPNTFNGIELPNLEFLDISGNLQIYDLPEQICNFKRLKYVNAAECGLETLPTSMPALGDLEVLILDNNSIKTFSSCIYSLKQLKILSMSNMPVLEEVTIDFALAPGLTNINFECNRNFKKLILNVPEGGVELCYLGLSGTPIVGMIATPYIFQSKIKIMGCDPNERSLSFHADKLGYIEIFKKFDCVRGFEYPAFASQSQGTEISLGEICWNEGVLKHCVLNLNKNSLSQDELIGLWNNIVIRAGVNILNGQNPNYDSSIRYLRNLYGERIEDDDNWINFTYAQYRPTMQALLSELFKTIGSSSLNQLTLKMYVESIFEMFKRTQGEQLVHFYHLLNIISKGEIPLDEFIQNSIAILKDYIFTMTVNLEGYNQKLLDEYKTRAMDLGLKPDNEIFGLEKNDKKYETELLPLFCSKFSPEWFIQMLSGALNSDEQLEREILYDLICSGKNPTDYFEYENVEGSRFLSKVKLEILRKLPIRAGFIKMKHELGELSY